jgi:hypothetical protein
MPFPHPSPSLIPAHILRGRNCQPCIKTVVFVIARSVLCDEAIPKVKLA